MVPCMTRSLGIILKRSNPTKPIYSILDFQEGVIVCFITREDICTGAYIEYTLCNQRTWVAANEVELIGVPCISQVADLFLLHRALEICSQCMPTGSSTPGVFEHMCCFYDDAAVRRLRIGIEKKIFLCKLFALLGFYPQEKKFQNHFFHSLTTESLDRLSSFSVSMVQESDMQEWLQSCVAMHAKEQKFKTGSIGEWVEIL